MQLKHHIHLAYCTNIHRGQNWPETFQTLQQYTLKVRHRVARGKPYAIGLRLSHQAALELSAPGTLTQFQRWLEKENCYVFTINGFPYGAFHGRPVKELAYLPDWTTSERVDYTNLLFDLLAQLLPPGLEGSVSTVPCSFKPLVKTQDQIAAFRKNLWRTVEHLDRLCSRSGKSLHLGLEPEPLCYLETTPETIEFFEQMRAEHPHDDRLDRFLGVNYDACHFAVEYEKATTALERFQSCGIRISKLHFSSAMKLVPTPDAKAALRSFVDPVYFHQVIARNADGTLTRYLDLDQALQSSSVPEAPREEEWRIHFHVPLHCGDSKLFQTTRDHLLEVLDVLRARPNLCSHLEMETYTWEVLPPELKDRDVVDQLVAEYEWALAQMTTRNLA